jgi:hypothetical protein
VSADATASTLALRDEDGSLWAAEADDEGKVPTLGQVEDLVDALGPGFSTEVVTELPSVGVNGVLYIVGDTTAGQPLKDYVWVESEDAFRQIGLDTIDLSPYATTTQLAAKVDAQAGAGTVYSRITPSDTNVRIQATAPDQQGSIEVSQTIVKAIVEEGFYKVTMALTVAAGLTVDGKPVALQHVRQTVSASTGPMETPEHPGETGNYLQWSGTIPMAAGWRVLQVAATKPCRVRLYDSVAHRDADRDRPQDEDPAPGAGCLLEVVFGGGLTSLPLSPVVDGWTSDAGTSVPALIDSPGNVFPGITVTFTWIRTE